MRTRVKLERLEKKFNLAANEVESIPVPAILEDDAIEAEVVNEDDDEPFSPKVFELDMLKQDFILVRAQLKKLISSGQNILSQAGVLDIGDMKASQLESLAAIQNVIGSNLKLLIDIYEKITKIEKMQQHRPKAKASEAPTGSTFVDKQIVFTGSTTQLLAMMSASNKADKEKSEQ